MDPGLVFVAQLFGVLIAACAVFLAIIFGFSAVVSRWIEGK